MDKNYIVKKSNFFIMNTSYDLSLEEQKIILTLASMVQPSDEEFKPYIFKISDFMELLGVNTKTKYTEIPKITKELMKKVFEIQEGNTLIQTAWLSGTRYEKGSGMVVLKFNPDLKPYMLQLNSMFTQYKLANILSMKSKYSPRVYELLKCNEFKKQGYIDIEVDDLRQLLKVENIYPRYYDFRRFIVEATQKELKKLTDISFDFEETRYGRKVNSIRFYINSNKSNVQDEVLATSTEMEEYDPIKKIMCIMSDSKITALDAKKIYNSAQGNIDNIYKVYQDKKDKPTTKNIVSIMLSLVKPGIYQEPKKNYKKDSFNDYPQRSYDFEKLEKKLLGWDKQKDEDYGEGFQQLSMNGENNGN